MSSLTELLERVKAATGADRELDADIERAFGEKHRELRAGPAMRPMCPPYSFSIDAALALTERVLPGWKRQLFEKRGGAGWIARVSSPQWDTYSSGEEFQLPTAPLAILAVTLQALIAKEAQ